MSLTIPFTFVGGAGNKAKASEVNANFAAVAAKFSEGAGGIIDGDISTTAAIKGSKLSTTPGNRIPTAALEDEAVTDAKLANDTASPGADAGRAVSGDHIKLLTPAHLARFLPDAPGGSAPGIGSNKLKLTFHEVAFNTGSIPSSGALIGASVAANPSSTFAQATYDLVGLYVRTLGGTATFGSAAPVTGNGGGPNWQGAVQCIFSGPGSVNLSGTLVYVFAQKA